jgi:hypothetical protein
MVKGILEKKSLENADQKELASYCLSVQTFPNSRAHPLAYAFTQELDGLYPLFLRFGNRTPELFGIAKSLPEAENRNYLRLHRYSKNYSRFEDLTSHDSVQAYCEEAKQILQERSAPLQFTMATRDLRRAKDWRFDNDLMTF